MKIGCRHDDLLFDDGDKPTFRIGVNSFLHSVVDSINPLIAFVNSPYDISFLSLVHDDSYLEEYHFSE